MKRYLLGVLMGLLLVSASVVAGSYYGSELWALDADGRISTLERKVRRLESSVSSLCLESRAYCS